MTSGPATSRIGDALVSRGVISPEQLHRALAQQKATGSMLGELLMDQGIISAKTLIQILAGWLGVPGCVLRHGVVDAPLLKLIGEEPDLTLMAVCRRLMKEQDVKADPSMLCRFFQAENISFKKNRARVRAAQARRGARASKLA